MAVTCFECQGTGHIAAECPNREIGSANGKPPWCGICDPSSRLVGNAAGVPMRCPDCHPLRGRTLNQFRRCHGCKMLIHEWDTAPCGQHPARAA